MQIEDTRNPLFVIPGHSPLRHSGEGRNPGGRAGM